MNRELAAAEKRKQISQEYGEPFVDVIKGFREQGVPWEVIAGTIGVTFASLRGWVRSMGIGDGLRMSQREWPEPLNDKARSLGYDDVADMVVSYWKSSRSKQSAADDLGCDVHSLTRFIPDSMKGTIPYSDKQKAAWKANAEKINQRRRENGYFREARTTRRDSSTTRRASNPEERASR